MASCLLASDAPSRRLLLRKKVHAYYYGITPFLYYIKLGWIFSFVRTITQGTLMWSFDLQTVIQRFIMVIRMQFFIFLSLVYIYLRRLNIFIIYHTLYIWWVLCNNIQAKKLYNSFCIAFDAQFSLGKKSRALILLFLNFSTFYSEGGKGNESGSWCSKLSY